MKPLDFVRIKAGNIALVTEINVMQQGGLQASVTFIGKPVGYDYNAWHHEEDLEVIDSLPRLLSIGLCHPFGSGKEQAKQAFPLLDKRAMNNQRPDGDDMGTGIAITILGVLAKIIAVSLVVGAGISWLILR